MLFLSLIHFIRQIPVLFFEIQKTPYDWQFRTLSKKACRAYENGCLWPRGKMLGGSSGLNAMIYIRGNRRDYDDWERFGNPSWGYNDVLEYFKKSEANQIDSMIGKYHGNKGMLKVDNYNSSDLLGPVLIAAATEKGFKTNVDLNGEETLGYSFNQGTIHGGERQSAARSFLVPAKHRPNLHIIKNALATRILFDDDKPKVKGIEFVIDGKVKKQARIRKEVIVSSGSVSTPQLLMLSGVGPEKHLRKLNVEVKRNLAVGLNLQDHIVAPMYFKFEKPIFDEPKPEDMIKHVYDYVTQRSGLLAATGVTNLCAFINTVNGTGFPDIELHHYSFARGTPGLSIYMDVVGYIEKYKKYLNELNRRYDMALVYVVLLNPKSVGKIQLNSTNPFDKPLIFPNYFDKYEDLETLVRGVKLQHSFIKTKTFEKQKASFVRVPIDECDDFADGSEKYFKCYIKHMSQTVYHPIGTAKMGPKSDESAVVDHRLRVHGVNGLRVIDASIMPKLVSGNTNAPTIMIGEKGADMIKSDWSEHHSEL